MEESLIGKKLHTSWGYSMTMNDFCQVLEVSPTGKTVKCQMLGADTNGYQHGPGAMGLASAGKNTYGPVFRLKVSRDILGHVTGFHGSYPFCGADDLPENTPMSVCSTRMGYFGVDNGEEHYESHCD